MKKSTKSTKQTRQREPQPVAAEPAALKPMDMDALRGHLRNLVCDNAALMVGATIEQARDGHYQAMKYLFEMIGLFPATAPEETHTEDSLAGMLLSRLGVLEGTSSEALATKNQQRTGCVPGNDVK